MQEFKDNTLVPIFVSDTLTPELIENMARAGIAVGTDGIFLETHHDPSMAKSDGANMLRLDLLDELLNKLIRIREVIVEL